MVRQLIVFFEGTGNTLRPPTTQVSHFAAGCDASDVTQSFTNQVNRNKPLKMQFDGCGVTNGMGGVLFASGLDDQCARVRERVQDVLKLGEEAVHVIALGLSRGGIACGKLALVLSATEELKTRVKLSLLMYDPVPGNFIWTKIPFTATQSQDLSSCSNLTDVLALYPHEPLPAIAVHAPLLYKYPQGCKVEEDVTLGCHQGALFETSPLANRNLQSLVEDRGGHGTMTVASNLSFRRIADWFATKGVKFQFGGRFYEPRQAECLEICRSALKVDYPTVRSLHDATGGGRQIVRSKPGTAQYLNRYHESILQQGRPASNNDDDDEPAESRYLLHVTSGVVGCFKT
jgi:hypothetical protein